MAGEIDPVRIVDDAIEDGVGVGGIWSDVIFGNDSIMASGRVNRTTGRTHGRTDQT